MEQSEFKRVLDIGLGRAILFLQRHDATPYREAILDACLHNTAYDPQVEGSRAPYMFEVIELADDREFYRERILAALHEAEDDWDGEQLFDFAKLFAQQGNELARRLMYEKCAMNIAAGYDLYGTWSLIELDGLGAFLFALDQIEAAHLPRGNLLQYEGLIWSLDERYGEEAARLALEDASRNNPKVAAFLAGLDELRGERIAARNSRADPATVDYDELRRLMDSQVNPGRYFWWRWGEKANDQDLERAARDLLAEDRPDRLLYYLYIFDRRPFPLDHQKLMTLAMSHDDVGLAALKALSNISDQGIRDLALELVGTAQGFRLGRVLGLFEKNYRLGDHRVIETALARQPDDDNSHPSQATALDIFEANPTEDAARALAILYERGPCSTCRERCVDTLHSLSALPDWMLEECRYDANFDLREKAREWSA